MKLIPFLTLTAAVCLCACDSKQEQARENALENKADRLEDQAKATKKVAEGDADATKRAADAEAKALKDAAEQTREQK